MNASVKHKLAYYRSPKNSLKLPQNTIIISNCKLQKSALTGNREKESKIGVR